MPALLITITIKSDRPRGEVAARTALSNLDGVQRLQRACERYGVTPTYLMTYPAITRPAEPVLADAWAEGRCELGACLQPWVTPPFATGEDRLTAVSPHHIAASTADAKLKRLVEAMRARYGRSPTAHRAPNGGLGGALLQSLERQGFVVDSSAHPYLDERARGGLDWRNAPEVPYFPDRQHPTQRGTSPVLEVPVSACWNQPLPQALGRGLANLAPNGLLGRLTQGLVHVRTLDPMAHDSHSMRDTVRDMVERGLPALAVALRSNELVVNQSKRCPTPAHVDRLFENLDVLMRYAVDQLEARPHTLSSFANHYANVGDFESADLSDD